MAIEVKTSQQYSFTEQKRIRKSFAKRASVLQVPFLLETQLASYRAFLQADTAPDQRKNEGLQAAFTSIFPISSHSGNARLEFVCFSLLSPAFDVDRVPAARPHLLLGAARQGAPDHHGQGGAEGDRQGGEGAGGLHGRDPAHDRQRLVRHQRHRARHRLAAAPLAGRVLRARPRQDALVGQAAVLGARDSLPRLVARLRVRPEGLPVLPRRPPPQDAGDDAAEGDRARRTRTSCASSSPSTPSTCRPRAPQLEFVPERLRGEMARFDVVGKDGKVVVARDKRITAKHIRELVDSGVKKIAVPTDYILGRALATNIVDTTTGEVLAKANDEITEELLQKLAEAGVKSIQTIYTNDLDQGAYISQTLRSRRHARPDGRQGGDLPDDAAGRAADRGRGRGAVPRPVLLRGALRPVGGGPDEVQPPRRPQRAEGHRAR